LLKNFEEDKMSKKNRSGDPRKKLNNKKYFGIWEYREDESSDYGIIMNICNKDKMFKFHKKNIPCDTFGISSYNNENFIGCQFLFGGKIINEIPSYWIGDDVKTLTKRIDEFYIPNWNEYLLNIPTTMKITTKYGHYLLSKGIRNKDEFFVSVKNFNQSKIENMKNEFVTNRLNILEFELEKYCFVTES